MGASYHTGVLRAESSFRERGPGTEVGEWVQGISCDNADSLPSFRSTGSRRQRSCHKAGAPRCLGDSWTLASQALMMTRKDPAWRNTL